jgi:hypothetical protein
VVAEGDFVVSRYTSTATDTVGFMGYADGPVHSNAGIPDVPVREWEDRGSWAARDDLGTLRQLGHLPEPAPVR